MKKKFFKCSILFLWITIVAISASIFSSPIMPINKNIKQLYKLKNITANTSPSKTIYDPKATFNQSDANDFLQTKNTNANKVITEYEKAEQKTNPAKVNVSAPETPGDFKENWIGYWFTLYDETQNRIIDEAGSSFYIDDHDDWKVVSPTWYINKQINPTHSFRIELSRYWGGLSYPNVKKGKSDPFIHSKPKYWEKYSLGNQQIVVSSKSFNKILDGVSKWSSYQDSQKDKYAGTLKLKSLSLRFWKGGADLSGYNNTDARIKNADGNHSNWKATFEKKMEYFNGIKKNEIQQVASKLFNVLKNSTQLKDIENGNKVWVDSLTPPKLHIGLNNDIFKAYNAYKNKTKFKNDILADTSLSRAQKTELVELSGKYKITKKNFNIIKNRLTHGSKLCDFNLQTPTFVKWITNKFLIIDGEKKTLMEWMNMKYYKADGTIITNYELLAQYLKNVSYIDSSGSKHLKSIGVKYRIFDGTDGKIQNGQKIDEGHSIIKIVPVNQLSDFSIELKNQSVSNNTPKIKIEEIIMNHYNPRPHKNRYETISVLPNQSENLKKYYIQYDGSNHTYSAYYQPNQLDISNGIWFYPSDILDTKYDNNLNIWKLNGATWNNTHTKAYKAIMYSEIMSGEEQKKAFIKTKNDDIKTWISTDTTKISLSDWLKANNKIFDNSKISYVLNKHLQLVINPYSGKSQVISKNGTAITNSQGKPITYLSNPTFSIEKITDKNNGKTNILGDFTDSKLSNTFNKAFGLTRTGKPTMDGILSDGEHLIGVGLKDFPTGDLNLKILIDTALPTPKYSNVLNGNEQLYYKADDEKYYKLFTSTQEISASLKEKGIKRGEISWVDSEGNWYTKDINVLNGFENGSQTQIASVIIDYQGLFKINFEDLAGNFQTDYLWLQKERQKDINIMSFGRFTKNGLNKKVKDIATEKGRTFWLNDTSSNDDLIITNLLASANNLVVKIMNPQTGQMELQKTIPSWITTTPQTNNSFGNTINGTSSAHSLAGDELSPFIDSSITRTKGKQNFYQSNLNIPFGTYAEIEVNTNIYKKTKNGNFVNKKSYINILNDDNYKIPLYQIGETHPNWNITEYDGTGNKLEDNKQNNLIDPSTSEKQMITQSPENGWIKVPKNFNTKINPEFTQQLKIEQSQIYYSWYKSQLFDKTSEVILKKEGKYKISYKDLLGNSHTLKYLVFDWPRSFKKYITRSSTIDKDKTIINTQTFYLTPGVATKQDSTTYHIEGEFNWTPSKELPKWSKTIFTEAKEFQYDDQLVIAAKTIEDVKKRIGIEQNNPIISINPVPIPTTLQEDNKIIKTNKWKVIIKGWSKTKLPIGNPIIIKYFAKGDIKSFGTPEGVPSSLTLKSKNDVSPVSDAELLKTAYWTGRYIDVYEESGRMEGLLIDHDNNPQTPKIHQFEDYDHYQTFLAEWLANGGTKDSFFKQHTNHDGTGGDIKIVKKSIDNQNNKNKSDKIQETKPLKIGVLFASFGTIIAALTIIFITFIKRSSKGYKKQKGRKMKKTTKQKKKTQEKQKIRKNEKGSDK